jgi:DNA-binding transcriptional LysR family regulator
MQSWDLIQAFLALHRTGAYEAAGAVLHVDHTTMRRRIQALEGRTGAALFVRSHGTLVLAPGHEALLNAALQMEAAYSEFLQQADLARHSGTIRVSTLDIIANLLAPDIAEFRRLHAYIQIEMTTESRFVDLDRERVDLAFRMARPLRGKDGLRRVATLGFGVYGSHEYAEGMTGRGGVHDLLSLYCEHLGGLGHEFLLADERWHEQANLQGRVVARADGYTTLLRMCEEGMGLAMLPRLLAHASPRLRHVQAGPEVGVYAVIRRDVAEMPKIRAFLAFMCAAFARHASVMVP